jgi:hypothetical protein
MAGLVPAIPIRWDSAPFIIGITGRGPVTTSWDDNLRFTSVAPRKREEKLPRCFQAMND